jgi:hypothetical protein
MEDFPIWLKVIIWLVVGSSLTYAIAAIAHTTLLS